MRITNAMMVDRFLSDSNNSMNNLSKYQQQVDTTRRVSNISDDPQATITALRARNKLSNIDMYKSNITSAKSYLSEAESAGDELNDILQTVYQRIVDACDGGNNKTNLSDIANELKSLQTEVVSIGNSTVGTTYLFGGFNFTGVKGADGKTTPPFSVDETTGHLMYNGIDLTKFSCSDDLDSCISSMTDCASEISQKITELGATSSDKYAKNTICSSALNSLNMLISSGNAALDAAEKFGIDTSVSDGYSKLSDFMSAISAMGDELSNECSKEISGDYILESDPSIRLDADGKIDYNYYKENGISVYTDEELNNCFSISKAQDILNRVNELVTNSDTTAGVGLDYSMADATSALSGELDTELTDSGARDALAEEMGNSAQIQIGTNSSINYTFTGLDIMGSGNENVYYIMDKCISLLEAGDTKGLSSMISNVQGAQSSVLNVQSTIGSTVNRLNLINTRYDTSEYNYTEMKSNAIDADMTKAITDYVTAKTVYNSALAAGAQIVQTSLLDYLR